MVYKHGWNRVVGSPLCASGKQWPTVGFHYIAPVSVCVVLVLKETLIYSLEYLVSWQIYIVLFECFVLGNIHFNIAVYFIYIPVYNRDCPNSKFPVNSNSCAGKLLNRYTRIYIPPSGNALRGAATPHKLNALRKHRHLYKSYVSLTRSERASPIVVETHAILSRIVSTPPAKPLTWWSPIYPFFECITSIYSQLWHLSLIHCTLCI